MANIELADLKSALEAEGVQVDAEALNRAFRKLSNPHGCENCGQHVKTATVRDGENGHGIYTNCCGQFQVAVDKVEDKPVRRRK